MAFESVIVLDTNVLSELMRAAASPAIQVWACAQAVDAMFTTAICEADLLFGNAAMAVGEACWCAPSRPFWTPCRQSGRPVGIPDLQNSAIARARNADAEELVDRVTAA